MKRLLSILLSLTITSIMVIASVSCAWAAEYPRLVDDAGLLSASEYETVLGELDDFSEKHSFDLVIRIVDYGLEDPELEAYADDFYDENGYGYGENHDGALLLIDMDSRMMHISTTGYGITVLTDYGIDKVTESIADYLGAEEYADALTDGFIGNVEWMYESAENGEPYDYQSDSAAPDRRVVGAVILITAFLISLLIAHFMTKAKKEELISIRNARDAASYLRDGSLKLTKEYDHFLYSNVIVNDLPDEDERGGSSTHIGSSGTSHGGGSRGF